VGGGGLGFGGGQAGGEGGVPGLQLPVDFVYQFGDRFSGYGAPGFQDYLVPVGFPEDTGDFRLHSGGTAAARDNVLYNLFSNSDAKPNMGKTFIQAL
jgi:hypothetical protein